jgi:hypothetical protein
VVVFQDDAVDVYIDVNEEVAEEKAVTPNNLAP